MYGLIGKMRATPGQRDALLAILLEGTEAMPGCLSYVIAQDPAEADAIWITEVWTDAASHTASLSLPAVQQAIAKARPLIAGFDSHVETMPVGGMGCRLPCRSALGRDAFAPATSTNARPSLRAASTPCGRDSRRSYNGRPRLARTTFMDSFCSPGNAPGRASARQARAVHCSRG